MEFSKVEPAYTSKDGCRLVWEGKGEDETDTVILSKNELDSLVEILKKDVAGRVHLEDMNSSIMVNSDVTQFTLQDHRQLEADTFELQKKVLEFVKIPHEPKYVYISSKEFYPSVWVRKEKKKDEKKFAPKRTPQKPSLLQAILSSKPEQKDKAVQTDIFKIFATRRSTRKFDNAKVESWKIDKILAAADTAPTAGNFQGLKIFYIKNKTTKEALVEAANKQPYVNAPVVLVFCMDPSRVNLKFPQEILDKFSLQDATLAAAYAQLAAAGLGLSSIWIGMLDEKKIQTILGTDLRPSSILCIGYPDKKRPPKSRRKLKELIEVIK
ncbi:MAG: nitroreductase [Nitrososphaeria archaeon]|nr:nitroreductase [Nitrosopumilaceae archaeon]NIP09046.1 nitroreductase [Nitrosopumilaceae archaeon]NIP91415.1 nitroreductase [Nitrososphaeria archaeon]NIS95242.1 nitroreductase [Nitrosopumilaceae archaeon]